MKSYIHYFKLRIITNLQYRMDAIAGIATQAFFGFMFIMVYLAFYKSGSKGTLPMNLNELVTYMWLQQAFFALIYPYEKDKELLDIIKNGNIAYELIRPQSFYLKWYIKMYSQKLVAVLLRSPLIIIMGLLLPYPFHLSLPPTYSNFIIFAIALILSSLLITSLNLFVHLITMFTLNEKGSINIYSVIAEIFMGATIPIPFFPNWLKKISDVLPFRYISDFPFRVYSGNIPLFEGYSLIIGSAIWVIITILSGYILSHIAIKKAVIQGG